MLHPEEDTQLILTVPWRKEDTQLILSVPWRKEGSAKYGLVYLQVMVRKEDM